MLVVCDSGPLIALAGIGHLEILPRLYGKIVVPYAVIDEVVRSGDGRAGQISVPAMSSLLIHPNPKPDARLSSELGLGAAAVITLAIEEKADEVLLDDRKARRIAVEVYNLPVRGTAALLVLAKRAGIVPAVRPLMEAMRSNGYYLTQKLIDSFCAAIGE